MKRYICKTCRKIFYDVHPNMKYCSCKCRGMAIRGKNNPMYRKHFSEKTKRLWRIQRKGNKNSWKGGIKNSSGYVYLYQPKHPSAISNYIRRSRLVMETQIGRYLTRKEVVHHINGITNDDRPENLKLFANNGKHTSFHNLQRNLL